LDAAKRTTTEVERETLHAPAPGVRHLVKENKVNRVAKVPQPLPNEPKVTVHSTLHVVAHFGDEKYGSLA
jgi:hypothetical protein